VTLWITSRLRRFSAPRLTFSLALRTAVPLAEAIAVSLRRVPYTARSGARERRRRQA
jgi:hypothetical protein